MASTSHSSAGIRDRFYFTVVGAYLSAVMLFLLSTGRLDPGVSWKQIVAAMFRRRTKGTIEKTAIHKEHGLCFAARIQSGLMSDAEGRSQLQLFENGVTLGPAHCAHDEIRQKGSGRYSHWMGWIYFSTSDNSSPLENGRTYTYVAK